jgi:hypothetical protein
MTIIKKQNVGYVSKVPTREKIDKIIDCIDEVVNKQPTLALRYSIIAEKVNKEYSLNITEDDVHNYYDTYSPESKLSNSELDKYLTLKNAGLI